jgi:hypothetical protein
MTKTNNEENNTANKSLGSEAERIRYEMTLNSVQLSNRYSRQSHQFADSIGGYGGNYKF